MDAQSAIAYSVSEFSTYRVVVAGYAAMQAGLTLQTVVQTQKKNGAGRVHNWFIPEYIIFARREKAPVDEVMQMVGRTFVDTKNISPPEDHQIQLLSTEGVITRLFAYQHLEDIFNGRIAVPLWWYLNWPIYGFAQEGDLFGAAAAMFCQKAPPLPGVPAKDWFDTGPNVKSMLALVTKDSRPYLPESSAGAALAKYRNNVQDLISLWEVPRDEEDEVNSMNPRDRYDRLCEDVHNVVKTMLFGKRRGKMEQLFAPPEEDMDASDP
jgi:hypothetical protein